jgi:hypothetical protein
MVARRVRILGLLAAGASVAACTSSTTATTYTPITGIEIRSAALVSGFGCGPAPGQVWRYVATVSYRSGPGAGEAGAPVVQNGVPLTNIFECFADGVFENLPSSDAGSLTFTVAIFAYSQQDYERAGLPAGLACPPVQDGGLCTPSSQAVSSAQEGLATWTTLCTATQEAGTPVIAVCGPLEGPAAPFEMGDGSTDAAGDGAAGAEPDATTTSLPDAGADATGSTPPDAGVDAATPAAPDASSDGGPAGPVDASTAASDG